MCLYSKTKIPTLAEHDIKCWKVVKFSKTSYLSPIQDAKLKVNKVITAEGEPQIEHWKFHDEYVIRGGFFHAFTTPNRARDVFCTSLKYPKIYYTYVCEAIIPKGSWYYKSVDMFGEICADKILIKATPAWKMCIKYYLNEIKFNINSFFNRFTK